ncbi:MAG: calcium/sodium antiporter [Lachnospiraceae bacterium]|nr:calcium/sodium antiporter [Lachnospiraceae bacterium]
MFNFPGIIDEVIWFIIGLICLVKGGDWFVDGSCGIARRFHMPEILIGATVVSIGTTIPEVMVSSTAALTAGASDMAYGNAIGSIICNTALVAAVTMAFRPAPVEKKALKMPVAFFFGAAALYIAVAYATGFFSRVVGIILLAIFVSYMIMCVKQAILSKKENEIIGLTESPVDPDASRMTDEYIENVLNKVGEEDEPADDTDEKTSKSVAKKPENGNKDLIMNIGRLILGAAVIAIGANLLVDNGTLIAEAAGVPKSVIALTFVALGTSLPELVTAITSLVKGHSDLSLGNVIGANLFNLVLVSGLAVTLAPFHIPVEKTIAGINASLVVDIPVMVAVMLIMCLPALIKGRIYRAQGFALLGIYAGYVIFQFA